MSKTINHCTIVGKIARAPYYYQAGDTPMAIFVVEVPSRMYTRPDGSQHLSRMELIPVKVRGKAVANIRPFLAVGNEVMVVGEIQTMEKSKHEATGHAPFWVLAHIIRQLT